MLFNPVIQSKFNSVFNPILSDQRFVSWCAEYLRQAQQEQKLGHLYKCLFIKRRARLHGIELNDFDWNNLWVLVNASKHTNYVDCGANAFIRFQAALLDIYNTSSVPALPPSAKDGSGKSKKIILDTKISDSKIDDKDSDDMAFTHWANKYLKRLIKEVARKQSIEQNVVLLREFRDAAHEEGVLNELADLSKFAGFPDQATKIDCKQFRLFKKPLRRIFNNNKNKANKLNITRLNLNNKETTVKPKIIIPDVKHYKTGRKVGYLNHETDEFVDLESIPAETLDVVIHPIALPGRLDNPEFKGHVARALLYALKNRNTKWVSGLALSEWFKVDRRNFEDWAKDYFEVRVSKTNGNLFFGLKSLLPNRVSKIMSSDESKAADEAETQTEAHPAVNTTEFETLIAQFLSTDAVWRSLDAMMDKLKYTKEELLGYLDTNAAIMRRPSKTAGKFLFALYSRCNEPPKSSVEAVSAGSAASVATPVTTTTPAETKKKDVVIKSDKPLITPKELLAFGMLHQINDSLIRVMNFYGNSLAVHQAEAFSHFSQAQKKLSDGVSLLKSGTKINDKLLPELEAL